LADHAFPDQALPDQTFADQTLPDQAFSDHAFAVHRAELHAFPVHEPVVQTLPLQTFPFHTPPDQEVPAKLSLAHRRELKGAPKMSFSPVRTFPPQARRLEPRARSSDPVPAEGGHVCVELDVRMERASFRFSIPSPCPRGSAFSSVWALSLRSPFT
jgi:hypothetical protein